MGWVFRKCIRIGKMFRINISKRGVGYSVGLGGVRYSKGPSGKRVRVTFPGTGVYYEERLSGPKQSETKRTTPQNQTPTTAPGEKRSRQDSD
ncbi:hypothetical protein GCM10025857_68290 [Alicyclobacillus contaminans]|nr:hypothetical protein GCM10025857_33630 [Alicyclobacillus contaminans]GMA55472.1 hypothetical protein GCM10025857_68290 [Alicyclobacillus contaminans]